MIYVTMFTSIVLPEELWLIICEYLPLHSLQHFTLSNKTLYTYIKEYCPNIIYDESINYDNDILPQLLNLTTSFILFSFLSLHTPYLIQPSVVAVSDNFIVIRNNCKKKKTLSNILDLTKCVENCQNYTSKHCGKTNSVIYPRFIELITYSNQLNFNTKYKSTLSEIIYVNGIEIRHPYIFFHKTITKYNFVLENSNVKEIYKNIFISVNNRVMSYFVKFGIKFYIMYQVQNYGM